MTDIRWKQRFENFEKAYFLLKESFEQDNLSDLEKEGVAQRFEYTFELGWKTLKDYLENSGIIIEQVTPKDVIKESFSANIIKDGQNWMDMLKCRNLLSQTYDKRIFDEATKNIKDFYLGSFVKLYEFFKAKYNE